MLIMCEVVSNECQAPPPLRPPPLCPPPTLLSPKGERKGSGYSVPGRPCQNVQTVHSQAIF